MRTLSELEQMLVNELVEYSRRKPTAITSQYYNEVMGDTSVLLTSILEEHLLGNEEWDSKKWLDDCLLSKVKIEDNKCHIWGVVIYGKENTLKQWTAPIYFEISFFNCSGYMEYLFLFDSENEPELLYEDFAANREFWDSDFYTDEHWNPSERSWKFIIHYKKLEEET